MDIKGKIIGVVAVAIALLSLAVSISSPAPEVNSLGGQRAGLQEFINGIFLGNKDNRPGVSEEWYSGSIAPASEESLVFRNTSGKDVFVTQGQLDVITGETASSSYRLFAFATTSSSVGTWADFGTLAEGKRALIHGVTIATSTTASTTSSVYARSVNLGNGSVLVPNNSYFQVFVQAVDTAACGGAGACEAATSTNRGFNLRWKFRVNY